MAFWPTCIAIRAYSAFEVVVVDLDRLGGGDGAQGEVDLDGLFRLLAQPFDERVRVLPGGRQPLLEVDALGGELADGVLHPRLQVALDHRLRRLDVDEPGQRLGHLRHQLLADPIELAGADALGDGRSPFLDRLELADVLGDPVVGELGQRRAPARVAR